MVRFRTSFKDASPLTRSREFGGVMVSLRTALALERVE
jgi:hypothetical protein